MALQVMDRGRYTLFHTHHGNRILTLNDEQFFAWVIGGRRQYLVPTDPDHVRGRVLQSGHYLLVEGDDEERLRPGQHLLLERRERYHLYPLPDGLPEPDGFQKAIEMEATVWPAGTLERRLAGGPSNGHHHLSGTAQVAFYLRGIHFPTDRAALLRHARARGAPKAVLKRLDKIGGEAPADMAGLMAAIGRATRR